MVTTTENKTLEGSINLKLNIRMVTTTETQNIRMVTSTDKQNIRMVTSTKKQCNGRFNKLKTKHQNDQLT